MDSTDLDCPRCARIAASAPVVQGTSITNVQQALSPAPMNKQTKLILGCIIGFGCLLPVIIAVLTFIALTVLGAK